MKDKLEPDSIDQYQNEERSLLVKRLADSEERLTDLLQVMKSMSLSPSFHMEQLRKETYEFTKDKNFKNAKSMGEIMEAALLFMKRNYKTH